MYKKTFKLTESSKGKNACSEPRACLLLSVTKQKLLIVAAPDDDCVHFCPYVGNRIGFSMSAWAFFYFTYASSGCGHIVVKTEKITEMENKLIRADLQEIGTGRTSWERTGIFQEVNY